MGKTPALSPSKQQRDAEKERWPFSPPRRKGLGEKKNHKALGMNRFSASGGVVVKQHPHKRKLMTRQSNEIRKYSIEAEYCYYRHSNRYGASTAPQFAFKILMIHILQFTLRIAFRCALHRTLSQDIHC